MSIEDIPPIDDVVVDPSVIIRGDAIVHVERHFRVQNQDGQAEVAVEAQARAIRERRASARAERARNHERFRRRLQARVRRRRERKQRTEAARAEQLNEKVRTMLAETEEFIYRRNPDALQHTASVANAKNALTEEVEKVGQSISAARRTLRQLSKTLDDTVYVGDMSGAPSALATSEIVVPSSSSVASSSSSADSSSLDLSLGSVDSSLFSYTRGEVRFVENTENLPMWDRGLPAGTRLTREEEQTLHRAFQRFEMYHERRLAQTRAQRQQRRQAPSSPVVIPKASTS